MSTERTGYDVVLIYPRTGLDLGSTIAPPYALLTVAAPLVKKGIRTRIIDQRTDRKWRTHLKEALRDKPVCCGISSMTGTQIHFAVEVAKVIREEMNGSVPIVWGGCHATILPEQTLRSPYADIIVVGEGDETFLELVEALSSKRGLSGIKGISYLDGDRYVCNCGRPLLDVDELLPTPWELVDVEAYIHADLYLRESPRVLDLGQTSRGCPYRCTFCSSSAIREYKWRAMSPEKSLDLITESVRRFKLDGLWLRDDEFYIDVKRATRICEGMIQNNLNVSWYTSGTRISDVRRATEEQIHLLKRSGAYVLKLGAESGSDRILKMIKKGQTVEQILEVNQKCKKFGIKPAYSLMCGFPTETFEEINQTIDLFFRLVDENPQASVETIAQYTALPGTELFKTALEMGLKPPQRLEDWANWLFHEPDVKGERIPWFNDQERMWIGNLNYLSILSRTGASIVSTIRNKPLASLLGMLVIPPSRYFGWRLRRKSYHYVPEVKPILAFQRYLFSRSNVFSSESDSA